MMLRSRRCEFKKKSTITAHGYRTKELTKLIEDRLSVLTACDRAEAIVARSHEIDTLYRKGLQYLGEGTLRNQVLNMATDAFEDESLVEEVFCSNENMLSFFCGVWIQYLLTEIAGVRKDNLRNLAQEVFLDILDSRYLH
jgi:hypothetical protein